MAVILSLVFIGVIVFLIYDSNYRASERKRATMASPQTQLEIKNMLKKTYINSIKSDISIMEVRGTEFEATVILNVISILHKSGMKNFVESRVSMGLTESQAINIVKTVTNEVMDIYISNSKQYHVK